MMAVRGLRAGFAVLVASLLIAVPASAWETGAVNSADGVRINYQLGGEGATSLVFVHGWSCDRSYWRGQLDHFARDYRVVAVDLAGHGGSGGERSEWTIEGLAQDVVAVIDALEMDQVILVGHSMGGPVVVEAAMSRPGKIMGVIGVDTLQDPDAPSMSAEQIDKMVARFQEDFATSMHALVSSSMFVEDSDPELKSWIAADMAEGAPGPGVGTLAANLVWHSTRRVHVLEALQTPLVLINSPLYSTDRDACSEYGIEVSILPRTGHFLMMEEPDQFNGVLASVLAGSWIDADGTGAAFSSGTRVTEGVEPMKVRYLEIVTPDVDAVCAMYTAACGVEFSPPVPELGNARTAAMSDGGTVGVRAPMHETEEPVTRPYYLVEDIQAVWAAAMAAGAEEMHPPLEIPGQGTFAIYMQGGVQHALWED